MTSHVRGLDSGRRAKAAARLSNFPGDNILGKAQVPADVRVRLADGYEFQTLQVSARKRQISRSFRVAWELSPAEDQKFIVYQLYEKPYNL